MQQNNLPAFKERIQQKKLVLLDGATGTELQRRGFELTSPEWSARIIREQPEHLEQVHRDYVDAGSEIVTANTFRTHARNLLETRWAGQAEELTMEAVEIARRAAQGQAYVAGSIAPLEDCYSPELTPSESELRQEHLQMAQNLALANVDLILVETQLTIRESLIAAKACRSVGLPFLVSFTLGRDGNLLSGESLTDGVETVQAHQPDGVLLNCLPVEEVMPSLKRIRQKFPDLMLGAYANSGRLASSGTWEQTAGLNPAYYAEYATRWKEFGISFCGGCCGTTPEHISLLLK